MPAEKKRHTTLNAVESSCAAASGARRTDPVDRSVFRYRCVLHPDELAIEWLRDGTGQRHQVVLRDVSGDEHHLTGGTKGHDGHVVDPARRRHIWTRLTRKDHLNV